MLTNVIKYPIERNLRWILKEMFSHQYWGVWVCNVHECDARATQIKEYSDPYFIKKPSAQKKSSLLLFRDQQRRMVKAYEVISWMLINRDLNLVMHLRYRCFLSEIDLLTENIFLNGPTPASFIGTKIRRQQDLHSDHQSRRQGHWPLYHHYSPTGKHFIPLKIKGHLCSSVYLRTI